MELEGALLEVVADDVAEVIGHVLEVDLTDRVPGGLEEPHAPLAEREHVEPPVRLEQRQQRSDVAMVAHHHELLAVERQPVRLDAAVGEEDREPVALVLPEPRVTEQGSGWPQDPVDA